MAISNTELLKDKAYTIDSRLLKVATLNTAVSEEGETEFDIVKNYFDYWYHFNIDQNEKVLLNKIYQDGTAQNLAQMEIRGAHYIKGETRAHPEHADCVGLLTPLFMNRTLHVKEIFEDFRKVKPEHPILKTAFGCFTSIVTQHGITLDPLLPNFGTRGQVNDEAGLFTKFPSAKEVETYEVAAHSGNLIEIQDLKSGFSHKLVLSHPEPFIRIKTQFLIEKQFLVVTDLATYPENVLKFEGRESRNYSESMYKGPKLLESPILDFILGDSADMSTVLGPLDFFKEFDLAYIKPGMRPCNPIGAENVLKNKGFNEIETIGQL